MSEVGRMVDFLKANPFVSMEEYRWKYSVPFIRLMAADNTRINYLTDKQAQKRKSKYLDGNKDVMLTDLGVPVFGNIKTNK